MIELWRDVRYRGKKWNYRVSNTGKVWSNHTKRLLVPWLRGLRKGTYPAIRLCDKGHTTIVDVHRLVALHFVYNPLPGVKREVNHVDDNGENNFVWNMEWVTRSENELHKYAKSLESSVRCFLSDRAFYKKDFEMYGDHVPF